MAKQKPEIIFWFRQDLRLYDNPGLDKAISNGVVLPIYIMDYVNSNEWEIGAASKVWLHHALQSLNQTLNNALQFFIGDPYKIISELVHCYNIKQVFWNRLHTPWEVVRDRKIKEKLKAQHIDVHSFNSSLLWEPWEVLKADGQPYKVFSAFKRQALQLIPPQPPVVFTKDPMQFTNIKLSKKTLSDLNLLPQHDWAKGILVSWQISEHVAHRFLHDFIDKHLDAYKNNRNIPYLNATSKLSAFLHFGQISPHIIWNHIHDAEANEESKQAFLSEIIWREFNSALLYYYPELSNQNWQSKFDRYLWKSNKVLLKAWQEGNTGIPIVDAGMRELWQTGFMHNRLRMIVASFLTKNCQIHWRYGAKWFWDCLVDADLANNSANWQWVAGSGADAAPFFRIFNPITQAQKFDVTGEYIRHYLPELEKLPTDYLFSPWLAPKAALQKAGVVLGEDYPFPIVELNSSRKEALINYKKL